MTLIPDSSSRRILLLALLAILGWQTSIAQTYCRPSLGSCCEWISNVTIGGINHNTINEPGYADYTAISTIVTKGATYPISVKVSTNSIYVEHVKIYFDWDRDYIFESFVYLGSARFTGSNVFRGEVTVPMSAMDGCSMMRVFMQYAQQPASACTFTGDGEVEDYTIIVSNSSIPTADFSTPNLSACTDVALSFTNASTISGGANLNFLWSFGDGTNSTIVNPSKVYAAPGTYQVKLTASTFCTSHSVTKSITVNPPPTITTQPSDVTRCAGTNATFAVATSASTATYKWQVNEGSGFTDIAHSDVYSDATTSAFHITGVIAAMHGNKYRCLVTTTCTTTSSEATLTVATAPSITLNPANASVCPGDKAMFDVTVTGSALSYQWQENSGNGFTNISEGAGYSNVFTRRLSVSGITTSFSNYQYRCVVTGTCAAVSSAATLSLVKVPVIISQPVKTIVIAGRNASFHVNASGDGLIYQWQENSGSGFVNLSESDVYHNVSTATLDILAAPISKNGHLYRCVVSGTCVPAATSNSTLLTVNNPKPVITSTPVKIVNEDAEYHYVVSATDTTGNPLTYSSPIKPAWLNFNPVTHVFSGTPTNSAVGVHSVMVQVSNEILQAEQAFSITVINTNDAPVITSAGITMAREDSLYRYPLEALDIDEGNVLSYSATLLPHWLTFDPASNLLTGIPGNDHVGMHAVTLSVTDGHATNTQNFTIVVNNINDVPIITSAPVITVEEDAPYSYCIIASDVDKESILSYAAIEKPTWLNFNPQTHVISGIPSNDEVGMHDVTLRVSDGTADIDQIFKIMVNNVNDAPVITSLPLTLVDKDSSYYYLFLATDVDQGDVLQYEALLKPTWLDFNSHTGVLSGKPNNDQKIQQVTLRVSDGTVSVVQSFDVVVIINASPNDSVIQNHRPTKLSLDKTVFESSTDLREAIGVFTTIDEDDAEHHYALVKGDGDLNNAAFKVEAGKLYVESSEEISYYNKFSIRVRSTDPSGNFLEAVFGLEKSEPVMDQLSIKIPNTFSPNGDEMNDKWIIKDLKDFQDVCIEVFDRSGVPLYKSNDPNQGWDGSMPGGKILEGPFFYIVRIKDVIRKGILIVVR